MADLKHPRAYEQPEDPKAEAAYEALDLAEDARALLVERVTRVEDGDSPAQKQEAAEIRELLDQGTGAVLQLGRAIVYALLRLGK